MHKSQRSTKHSSTELKRLLENAIETIGQLSSRGLWMTITEVESSGSPPHLIRAWGAIHFLREGSPFCCFEPECHVDLFSFKIQEEVARQMGVTQPLTVEFVRIKSQIHDGVEQKDFNE